MSDQTVEQRIAQIIESNDVALFMKGTPEAPMCGFSSVVVQVIKLQGVDFFAVDVMQDPEIRQGIKDYSDWPTIPQLYVKGEFIGGCDILKEMHLSGELKTLFDEKGIQTQAA